MSDELDAETPSESSVIKDLRAKANKASEYEAQNAELAKKVAEMERTNAFRDAGLDLSNKLHLAASDGYKGEIDKDAITQWATDLGLAAPPVQQVPEQEQQAFQRLNQAQAGGDFPPPAPNQDQEMVAFMQGLNPGVIDKAAALQSWLEQRGDPTSNQMVTQDDIRPW
jgi:hypothetical protein